MEQTCPWVRDEYDAKYHDSEWCVPEHDDKKLFEFLILEGMQAGLSWNIVLKKREAMRAAFDGFTPEAVAEYGDEKKAELLQNAGIIRNRAKINALVGNAQAFLKVQKDYGSFDAYIWGFTDGKTIQNALANVEEMPATSDISDEMSKALKKLGFRFVGSTICYSYMQAIGMVNDHLVTCPQYEKCARL